MMNLDIETWIHREIHCGCGRTHYCPIERVLVENGALQRLAELTAGYRRVTLVGDENTYPLAGEAARALLGAAYEGSHVFRRAGHLVPDERAVAELEAALSDRTDLVVGIGSGVINDICKYVTWKRGMDYGIVGTAPSMDGYASSGAAMIVGGMKVTYTTRPPKFILCDVDIVKNAPLDMIRAGYGDIIGKYSSLNDWRLARMIRDEFFCQPIHDLVLNVTNDIRDAAERIVARDDRAIAYLTKALILIGVTLTLVSSTRPGSGSEHHLSHFFEIVGLIRGEDHFCHGTDVGYATVVTAGLRERIAALETPVFRQESAAAREAAWARVYGPMAGEVAALQAGAGSYARDLREAYRAHWPEIRALMRECPTAADVKAMLVRAGYDPGAFEAMYGRRKIDDAVTYGKDLKDRYSVLWLYYALFSGAEADA